MKKEVIKRQIIIPMVSITLICGLMVLFISFIFYERNLEETMFLKAEKGSIAAESAIQAIREKHLTSVFDVSREEELVSAIAAGNSSALEEFFTGILSAHEADYGLVTDKEGTALLRAHEPGDYGDSVMHLEQIRLALEGEPSSSIISHDKEAMRIVACSPVYDSGNNIIGSLTLGTLIATRSNRNLVTSLKTQTGCEFTIFEKAYDGDGKLNATVATSTFSFSALAYIANGSGDIQERIINSVITEGTVFRDELQFLNDDMYCEFYPIYNFDGEIAGMLFVGVMTSETIIPIIIYLLVGGGVALAVSALSFAGSSIISKNIINRIDVIEQHMLNRDKLFEAVNRASIILLEIDETDDIRTPLISCMEHIGLALNVDRVHLWRGQTDENGINQFVREYSWVSEYGKRKAKTPKYITSTSDDTHLDWMDKFLKNEHISGVVNEMESGYQLLIRPLDAKAIAMIPLFLEEQFWGMFTVDTIQDDRNFSDDEINILHSVSLMMANIVRRHDLQNENLKVYFDALTGINNRRYFDKTMARTISSLSRAGSDLGVMMIDVDFFKKYNDTYGHGAGDECLIRVAEILAQSATRVDDFVARYGGEEFVVVMPNTDRDGAISVANRMLENIRAAKIPHKASDVNEFVTVSIGVTTGKVKQHHVSETFVQKADDMLYKSKHDGRDRFTYGELK